MSPSCFLTALCSCLLPKQTPSDLFIVTYVNIFHHAKRQMEATSETTQYINSNIYGVRRFEVQFKLYFFYYETLSKAPTVS